MGSVGGVSTEIEQSYTATVLNTAKSISKGLVKISESVVNSVVSKSKSSGSAGSSASGGGSGSSGLSPRLNDPATGKQRHDSKDEYQPGICTIVDTKKFLKQHAAGSAANPNSTGRFNLCNLIYVNLC